MKSKLSFLAAICSFTVLAIAATPDDGSVLPFPATPLKESVATPRLQDAKMKWPTQPQRMPNDAPSILIILLDDINLDLGSTVADIYYERRPFIFDGKIHTVKVSLK
jgi:hypothetical protein